ncbi:alpha/beta hydrolase fold protein [Kribbella flavida DSM 17836]|uniref:Alpha/beta hydrolase fold protein n=1 Tax=Kribbella flavida (strain DSM 17836 / JCM 10339 / NBRC 14399) TaxID=479435 RepID=D2PSD9_KRIFD|nr:alpha/beta hydrolase [Kribbella flavida]ADB33077.1 alpha/beta hydrolase fold protein [Kribbella flavida DSM 17836]
MDRKQVRLGDSALEYVDTESGDHTIVLLHGALMDEHLWAPVVERLRPRARCIVPVLPLGAHRVPRPKHADQSPAAIARLVGELIRSLALQDVTLVGNDTGGALAQLLVADDPALVNRLVLVSADAFENFPPGLPGRTMAVAGAVPGGLRLSLAMLRIPALRRLPMTFGWMTKRPIEAAVFDGWLDAFAADRRVRRDIGKMMKAVNRRQLVDAAAQLHRFDGPALIVWAAQDRVMPVEHAERLARVLKHAEVALVDDAYTLVPLDQPERLAHLIADFVTCPA